MLEAPGEHASDIQASTDSRRSRCSTGAYARSLSDGIVERKKPLKSECLFVPKNDKHDSADVVANGGVTSVEQDLRHLESVVLSFSVPVASGEHRSAGTSTANDYSIVARCREVGSEWR